MLSNQQKRLKIVMVLANHSYPADPRVRNEAETLSSAGHELTVLAPRAKKQAFSEAIKGVRVLRYPAPLNASGTIGYALEFAYVTIAAILGVLFVWARHGLDVVHVHNPPDTLFMAGLIPKLFGKKLVYDHHDLAPELYLSKFEREGGFLHSMLLLLEKFSAKAANRLITVNQSYQCSDSERNGVKPERITVVRNAPPTSHLAPVVPDSELRKRAGILAGYLGSIAHQDGVDHMIKALHHVESDFAFHDWYAVIVGASDDFRPLIDLAEDLGIREKLWFTGYQPESEWRRLLATVDICFVPDPANALNDKSTMIKMMDYMALGKPVVAYALTENKVSGGDAALYAEPSEPIDLAKQFMRLVENEALRADMGQRGKDRIRETLAWEYSAKNLLKLYHTL
jgi:glycosyltransferase involved in cell wall biosynthesis